MFNKSVGSKDNVTCFLDLVSYVYMVVVLQPVIGSATVGAGHRSLPLCVIGGD